MQKKLLQGVVPHELTAYSIFNLFLTQWIMVILLKGFKPDNWTTQFTITYLYEYLRPSYQFVECESFLESHSHDILAICETNLDDSIDSGNFSVAGFLSLIWKDYIIHMRYHAVYVKEGIPFAQDISLENSADSYLGFQLALLHSLSYFFFLCWSPSSSLCTVCDSISSNIDMVLSVNPSVNVFAFGDISVHHKDWLT